MKETTYSDTEQRSCDFFRKHLLLKSSVRNEKAITTLLCSCYCHCVHTDMVTKYIDNFRRCSPEASKRHRGNTQPTNTNTHHVTSLYNSNSDVPPGPQNDSGGTPQNKHDTNKNTPDLNQKDKQFRSVPSIHLERELCMYRHLHI